MTSPAESAPGAGWSLQFRTAQRDCRINMRFVRSVMTHLLESELDLEQYDLTIHLISAKAMARANRRHMNHDGPTDVITFDYAEDSSTLHGELLICPAVAKLQAREHGTTWMSEIVRYAVHGVLHLRGYDDLQPADRRRMRREEDRLMRALERTLDLRKIRKAQQASRSQERHQ